MGSIVGDAGTASQPAALFRARGYETTDASGGSG